MKKGTSSSTSTLPPSVVYVSPSHYTSLLSVIGVAQPAENNNVVDTKIASLGSSSLGNEPPQLVLTSSGTLQRFTTASSSSTTAEQSGGGTNLAATGASYIVHPYSNVSVLVASYGTATTGWNPMQHSVRYGLPENETTTRGADKNVKTGGLVGYLQQQHRSVPSLIMPPLLANNAAAERVLSGILQHAAATQRPTTKHSGSLAAKSLSNNNGPVFPSAFLRTGRSSCGVLAAAAQLCELRHAVPSSSSSLFSSRKRARDALPPLTSSSDAVQGDLLDGTTVAGPTSSATTPHEASSRSTSKATVTPFLQQAKLVRLLWALTSPQRSPVVRFALQRNVLPRADFGEVGPSPTATEGEERNRAAVGVVVFQLSFRPLKGIDGLQLSRNAPSSPNDTAELKVQFGMPSAAAAAEEVPFSPLMVTVTNTTASSGTGVDQQSGSTVLCTVDSFFELCFVQSHSPLAVAPTTRADREERNHPQQQQSSPEASWLTSLVHGWIARSVLRHVLDQISSSSLVQSSSSRHSENTMQRNEESRHPLIVVVATTTTTTTTGRWRKDGWTRVRLEGALHNNDTTSSSSTTTAATVLRWTMSPSSNEEDNERNRDDTEQSTTTTTAEEEQQVAPLRTTFEVKGGSSNGVKVIVEGVDGTVIITVDGGATATKQQQLPLAEFLGGSLFAS